MPFLVGSVGWLLCTAKVDLLAGIWQPVCQGNWINLEINSTAVRSLGVKDDQDCNA